MEKFPQLGPVDEELEYATTPFRKFHIINGRYRVTYFIDNSFIIIAAVTDNRQNPDIIKNLLTPHKSL
ncbi:MAG: hypothetical protein LUH10_06220 [Tannerellaceae bacterium]|nr:hypothetical protein [Tannerellaceae bacterium]